MKTFLLPLVALAVGVPLLIHSEELPPNAKGAKEAKGARPKAAQRAAASDLRTDIGGLGPLGRILTPEQRETFRTAFQEQRRRLRELDEQLSKIRQDLDEAMLAETLDEVVIREKAKQLSEAEGERLLIRARAIAKVRPSLTNEQLAELRDAMAQTRRARGPNGALRGPAGVRDDSPRVGQPDPEGASLPPPRPNPTTPRTP